MTITEARPQVTVVEPEVAVKKPKRKFRRRIIAPLIAGGLVFSAGGATVNEAQKFTGGSYWSAISEIRNGPSDKGEITLDASRKYNFVAVGDSLAAGVGGETKVVDGKKMPSSWVEEIVDTANKKSPDIARQLFFSQLADPGSSADELNGRILANSEKLVNTPNLVLCMSVEYKNLTEFVAEMKEGNLSILETRGLLRKHLEIYSEDLKNIKSTLNEIKIERRKKIGKG